MRATIDECGVLIVEPETTVEAYALKHWMRNYSSTGEQCESVLFVRTHVPAAEGDER